MRTSLCWGCILSVSVTSQAVGQTRARFSADAVTLLEQLTQGYDLNGRRMPSGKVDDAILARLAKSTDPNISEVARMAPELKLLQALNRESPRAVARAFGEQVERMPASIAL